MGLLDRLMRKDPEKELIRIETLLEKGDGLNALKRLRLLEKRGEGPWRKRTDALLERVQDLLASEYLARATRAQSAGAHEDAAEWIVLALEHIRNATQRSALEQRMDALRQKTDPEPVREPDGEEEPAVEIEEGEHELDPAVHFETLVSMLKPEPAELYLSRDPSFPRLFVLMNQGLPKEALEGLNALVEAHGDDPVYLLERARCRLMVNEVEEALKDLQAVWPVLGDDPIDLADALCVPGLWAEAMLRLGRPGPVVERLAPLADPANDRPNLAVHYATALEMDHRMEEAVRFLAGARTRFTGIPAFPFCLARVLNLLGDWQQAIQCLEAAIVPSCSGNQCMAPPKHVPSFRALISLYLEHDLRLGRVRELLDHVARALNGQMEREDYLMLAAYHKRTGDMEAAQKAENEAKRLAEAS